MLPPTATILAEQLFPSKPDDKQHETTYLISSYQQCCPAKIKKVKPHTGNIDVATSCLAQTNKMMTKHENMRKRKRRTRATPATMLTMVTSLVSTLAAIAMLVV
eukprot:6680087-Pyramimonas_sp.AAC.1